MTFKADLEKHEYWLGSSQLLSITDCLRSAGLIDIRFATDYDLWVGTATHRAIELYNKGTLDLESLDQELKDRLGAWIDFLQKTGFRPKESEKSVYSPILRIAGTLDVLGDFPDGSEGIVEIKSGNVGGWCAIQTAGQDILLGGNKHRRRFGLKVPRMGDPRVTPHEDMDDYAVFRACVTVSHWKLSH